MVTVMTLMGLGRHVGCSGAWYIIATQTREGPLPPTGRNDENPSILESQAFPDRLWGRAGAGGAQNTPAMGGAFL